MAFFFFFFFPQNSRLLDWYRGTLVTNYSAHMPAKLQLQLRLQLSFGSNQGFWLVGWLTFVRWT
jgi:hypothetical protein